MNIVAFCDDIVRALEDIGAPYRLTGAIAGSDLGISRTTLQTFGRRCSLSLSGLGEEYLDHAYVAARVAGIEPQTRMLRSQILARDQDDVGKTG